MRRVLIAVVCVFVSVFCFSSLMARDKARPDYHVWRYWSPEQYAGHLTEIDPGLREIYSSAAVDTYMIVHYDFEPNSWQGWTQVDNTAQHGSFFHADDFAGLEGGDFGRLVPIEGSKSIWCGARPGTDEYMCGWYYAPGYGNGWDQWFRTWDIRIVGEVHFSFHGVFDSEAGYDFTYVEWARGSYDWVELDAWSGVVDTMVMYEVQPTKATTKFRFRFVSDRTSSDQDGGINTDGACVIDQITISDNTGVIDYEDFEDWDVGDTESFPSIWWGSPEVPYGQYSGLAVNLLDKDPCQHDYETQIVFFIGSPDPSEDYPGLSETPYCQSSDPFGSLWNCQDEMVISPVIDLTKYSTGRDEVQDADIPPEVLSDLGGTLLRFTLYGDGHFSSLARPDWYVRNVDETGCPGNWNKINQWVYCCPTYSNGLYYFVIEEIGRFIEEDRIQVGLACTDYCGITGYDPEYCDDHNPAPWYDNVYVQRYTQVGPQWSYRALDLFQDNFPEDEFDIESFVRADAADDKASIMDPFFRPGDSIAVTCASPLGGGIREGGVTGGGEVYLHVRCFDVWSGRPGGPKPDLYGPSLEGTCGTYVGTAGEWTILQCDTAKMGWNYPIPDQWSVDLNDSLLTRGYMVEYYFSAMDVAMAVTTLPEGGVGGFAGDGLTYGPDRCFEFTCLPTGGSTTLYVDDFDGRGSPEGIVQLYFDQTFAAVRPPETLPDRYDVNSPSSMVGNGLASRATLNQLIYDDTNHSGYLSIIWDSGDLDAGTIGDGTYEKADDCSLLNDWLNQSDHSAGLLVCGDNIAYDLSNRGSPQALMLMNTWCGVNFIANSYLDLTGGYGGGGVVNPLVTGAGGGILYPLEWYLYGGCPQLSAFDVLEPMNDGANTVLYPEHEGSTYAAGIQSTTTNAEEAPVRTLWLGFSWMAIRDVDCQSPIARNLIFNEISEWMIGTPNPDITGDETPTAYSLTQNYPNPFNPATTIRFDIREKGLVRLRIYNVAGQLVRTLVDGELEAGSYAEDWNGLNNDGKKVASGVYFYRLEADTFESVKKMVLLR